jgi:hypothetical protein
MNWYIPIFSESGYLGKWDVRRERITVNGFGERIERMAVGGFGERVERPG